MKTRTMLAAACVALAHAAGLAQPMLRNGDFESAKQVKGPASHDIGFGVWQLTGKREAPDHWSRNTAYPGELSVVSTNAPSGQRFVRLDAAQSKRGTHLYQMVQGLAANTWYRVTAQVRGGPVKLCFYEYFDEGPIRVPDVCAVSSPAKEWQEISGYYVPRGQGFKHAALAITLPKGAAVSIDNVKIEPLAAPAMAAASAVYKVENEHVRMELTGDAILRSLTCKATGVDYAAPDAPVPVFHARVNGSHLPARALRLEGDVLHVQFADPKATARVRVEARGRYLRFEAIDVQPQDMDALDMELPMRKLTTQGSAFSANYDEEFATCAFALNLPARCALRRRGSATVGLSARCEASRGIAGARWAVVAVPRREFNAAIQDVERENGLPSPKLDGKWVRESEPIRRSYLFAIGMHEDDTDALIEAARLGHFQTILILKNAWLKTHGHYEINRKSFPDGLEGLKRTVAKIHAAGLKAGVHVFGPSISPNDPYVTPVPDDRLLSVPCPPLAEAVDAKATVLTLAGQPDLPPKRSRNRAFPGFHVRVGDELIRYADVEEGPPFRFIGCKRGALGTTAAAHAKGATVRGMLTMWGYFMMDPDSTLLDEVTTNFAAVINACKFDMVYFDASDGSGRDYVDTTYYLDKCHLAHYRKLDHDVLYQTSTGTGRNMTWHFVARSASADGHGDIKWYLDQRLKAILGMKQNFTYADVGWYGLDLGSRPDRLEYVCAKCLGADGSISVQANTRILSSHPHAREIIEMIGRYERCRLANYFPEPIKAKLRAQGQEFKLFDDGKGGWSLWHAAYEPDHVITRLDGKQNVWTVEHDRAEPCRVAVEITRGVRYAVGQDYESAEAILLEDFEDVAPYEMSERNQYEKYVRGGGKVLTDEGPVRRGVSQTFTRDAAGARVGKSCGVYSAANTGADYGWCGRGKRFPKPVDLSRSRGIAFWIHGDAQNATFMLQLRDTKGRHASWSLKVGFNGWRLHVFPIGQGHKIDWRSIEYMIFYYNSIRSNTTISCKLDDVKALPALAPAPALSGLELTVNGQRVPLPGELAASDSLTTDGQGACTIWPGGMKPGRVVAAQQTAFTLKPGRNELKFTCRLPKGCQPDVNIRLIRLWPVAAGDG